MKSSDQIFFYEREHYMFSNFSSFTVEWKGFLYMTSEHAYHTEKFEDPVLQEEIRNARSAYEALTLAKEHKSLYRKDWDEVKIRIMKEILHAKVEQHTHIREKLLESGDREIVENSPVDDFWGWGPDKNGMNHLGKLWMEVREEVKTGESKNI